MTFTIGGTDIKPYIASKGIVWSREDVDGANAGRATDGTLIRDRVATKYKAEIKCKPLTMAECGALFALIAPEWVTVVSDTNPFLGGASTTYTMYSNNISAGVETVNDSGDTVWSNISFPLVQQ